MKTIPSLLPLTLAAAILLLAQGCSSEDLKRTTYDTLQEINHQQCLKNPQTDCPSREGYDDYKRKREEVKRGDEG